MSFKKKRIGIIGIIIIFFGIGLADCTAQQPQWPEITQENKPWSRWWWHGNAVNDQDLTNRMEQYAEANLGGLEITPIYGVSGYEEQFTSFLTPAWMQRLEHTLAEGDRLGLGIDMATGSGWPFGATWITEDDASKRLYFNTFKIEGGQQVSRQISYTQEPYVRAIGNSVYDRSGRIDISEIEQPMTANDDLQMMALEQVRFEKQLPLVSLMAYSDAGDILDLTDQVSAEGQLEWSAPEGDWTLYALFTGWHGKMVERAAPGGEGFVIDHFSSEPFYNYVAVFDTAFAGSDISSLRSFFNDSYEVDDAQGQADWTPDFFAEFEERRGYDLRNHLPALLENRDTEKGQRVLTDYRETISDLLLEEFTDEWDAWAEQNDAMIRNQAHGSPANILDLYAASDIPETEGTDILRAKMASSAANVTGKPLASSESATWLNEHFRSSLGDVKTAIDRYFISGINHIVYHGTAYSPNDDQWPGWLFYAAVHFNERNPFWDHFADFNNYVARTQSFLQAGEPDNDILLYYAIHDQWAQPGGGLLRHFDGGLDGGFDGTVLKQSADEMVEEGYMFDFISDRQVRRLAAHGGELLTGDVSYRTIVVPQTRYIPLKTMQRLTELARQGATVLFYQGLPEDVSGLGSLESRRQEFSDLTGRLNFQQSGEVEVATIGGGAFVKGKSLHALLDYAGVDREPMVDRDLQFVRRSHDAGHIYFVTNWGGESIDGWVPIAREASSAALFDPMQGTTGYANVRQGNYGGSGIYLQLNPGESRIIKTYESQTNAPTYPYIASSGAAQAIEGEWTLSFTKGGPELPADVTTETLGSWTAYGEPYERFSGTGNYSITFERPESHDGGWLLNLGDVHESASVSLNGEKLGTLIGPEFELYIPADKLQSQNTLEIEVANLMANRISWIEQQNIEWKKFYNINFPARLGENVNSQGLFDASDWEPLPSGLVGPVTLTPVSEKEW